MALTSFMNERLSREFVLLVLYGVMKDNYLPFDSQPFFNIDTEFFKIFDSTKEKVKNYFEVNYHKIFRQDNIYQSIYVIDHTGNFEFLRQDKREYLEKLFRDLLINIYTALYTINSYYQYINEPEVLNQEKLYALLSSFGLYEDFFFLPVTVQRRLIRVLVRLYKRKGTHYVYSALRNILGLNYNLDEIYAYVPFDNNSNNIEFEYYDKDLEEWVRLLDADLYDQDVRAFTNIDLFLR